MGKLGLGGFKLREEGVVCLFLGDRGQRAVAPADNGVPGEGHDFLPVVFEGIWEGDDAAAHQAREDGITHDHDRVGEAFDHKGGPTDGVSTRGVGIDVEPADLKLAAG